MVDEGSKRLVIYGFIKSSPKNEYEDTADKRRKQIKKWEETAKGEDKFKAKEAEGYLKNIDGDADHDEIEMPGDQMMLLNHPKPLRKWVMTIENPNNSVEPYYFFCMNQLNDWGFTYIDKFTDAFTAAEHSSFYGAAGQKLGMAQDKVGQYLATIGKMIKDMFQLVRELRWIDERVRYYEDSDKKDTAMTALKGLWVDLVDGVVGGQRTGSNLFTMAQQLQFAALPDLFFDIHPRKTDEIDKVVDQQAKEFNKTVVRTLKRKLYNFLAWKDSTYKEIINRRLFTLKYLRQHYNVIRMYINWCKPYIRHIERLKGNDSRLSSPEIVAAFESSMVEIEIMGRKIPKNNSKYYACLMESFEYKTKPSMQYQTEGYHRGPIHAGVSKIVWRAYAWDKERIENYRMMKEEEDLEMMKVVDDSLRDAMESLGDDLNTYLKEAGEAIETKEDKKEEEVKKPAGLGDIFNETFKEFGSIFKSFAPKKNGKPKAPSKKEKDAAKAKIEKEIESAGKDAKDLSFKQYDIFKKAHGMLSW